MLNKIIKLIPLLFNLKIVIKLLSMYSVGYLADIGWVNSRKQRMPVDINNNPIPWVTYPFIDFISGRLNKTFEVLEFGSGNSSHWYAKKVKFVTCVEHNYDWLVKIKNELPVNVSLSYIKLERGKKYSMFSTTQDKKYDVIIVDGRDRVNCIKNSIESLSIAGVIVLDDSERKEYESGVIFLKEQGFKMLDFWGISPGLFYKKCTTIFYKNNNCLNI